MITITQEQAQKRFPTIPSVLQDAIFSEHDDYIIDDVAEANHLDDDRAGKLAVTVGWVFLGFLHPEDLPDQLREDLNIPREVAVDIASALNKKIFNPIRAELDSAYAPAPTLPSRSVSTASSNGPKILEEIRPVTPVSAMRPPMPMGGGNVKYPFNGGGVTSAVGSTNTTPVPSAPVVRPAFSGSGWSKMSPAPLPPRPGMSVSTSSLSSLSSGSPQPVAMGGISPMPRPTITGNLQKTDMGKLSIPLPPTGVPASAVSSVADVGPAPVFIGTDAATMPIPVAPDLSMKSTDKIAAIGTSPKPVARPAVIEFGNDLKG